MFYDKFFEYYKQELEKQKVAYAQSAADLKAKFEETKAMLQKDYEDKTAACKADMIKAQQDAAAGMNAATEIEMKRLAEEYAARNVELSAAYEQKAKELGTAYEEKLKKMHDAYAEEIAKTKAEYEEYKQGVATREDFDATQKSIDGKFKEIDEWAEKLKNAVGSKVKGQDSKIAEVEKTLQASDARKMSGKLQDIEEVIDGMVNPVVPLIIAILAFLIAAGLCVLMALDLNPFKKPEETVEEAVVIEEAVDPCKDGHTTVLLREVLPYKSESGEQMPGERIYICTVCKEVVIEEIPAHVHNFIGEETLAPTLTEDGVTTYTCDGCEDTYTEAIPALLSGMMLGEDSTHPCKDALLSLVPNAVALDPATVNTAISADYAFNPDTMMWFMTETGDGILVINPAAVLDKEESDTATTENTEGTTENTEGAATETTETTETTEPDEEAKTAEQLMEEELAKLDTLAGVSGKYIVIGDYILVQVDDLEPVADLKSRMVAVDLIPVQLEDFEDKKNKAKAIGNAIPVAEETPTEGTSTEGATQTEANAGTNS